MTTERVTRDLKPQTLERADLRETALRVRALCPTLWGTYSVPEGKNIVDCVHSNIMPAMVHKTDPNQVMPKPWIISGMQTHSAETEELITNLQTPMMIMSTCYHFRFHLRRTAVQYAHHDAHWIPDKVQKGLALMTKESCSGNRAEETYHQAHKLSHFGPAFGIGGAGARC
jgi:hypothetical protein